jgi:hypothetical protein
MPGGISNSSFIIALVDYHDNEFNKFCRTDDWVLFSTSGRRGFRRSFSKTFVIMDKRLMDREDVSWGFPWF